METIAVSLVLYLGSFLEQVERVSGFCHSSQPRALLLVRLLTRFASQYTHGGLRGPETIDTLHRSTNPQLIQGGTYSGQLGYMHHYGSHYLTCKESILMMHGDKRNC